MSDEKAAADLELDDAMESIRGVGENLRGDAGAESGSEAEVKKNPNPPLPDWGSDGVAAEDEPAQ